MAKLSDSPNDIANILSVNRDITAYSGNPIVSLPGGGVCRMLGLFPSKRRLLSDAKLLGRWGEKRCRKYLQSKGLKHITHNFSCKYGELDLVMADKDGTLVFVEVKTRVNETVPVEELLDRTKRQRMIRTARFFLKTHNANNRPCRFDFVAVVFNPSGNETIKHYKNVFTP